MDITLLGPQRRVAGARAAVAELIPNGPVATINAGWRERETDTDELDVVLGGRMVNLELYRRWQQLSDDDLEFAAVASLSVARRYPETFGALLLQSGSFVFTDIGADHGEGPSFDPVVRFVNRRRIRRVVQTVRDCPP